MKKVLWSTAAAALFILSLSGCAGTAEPVKTEDRPQTTVEVPAESTAPVEGEPVLFSAGDEQPVEDSADGTEDGAASEEPIASPELDALALTAAPAPKADTPVPEETPASVPATPAPQETPAPAKTVIKFDVTTQKGTEERVQPTEKVRCFSFCCLLAVIMPAIHKGRPDCMKGKLLFIDDEQMILNMLKKNFEMEGYTVFTADTADKALKCLKHTPDLILLDINMPDMDGLELCSLIRAHISCPIIFLTARVTEQDKINGLMIGGDDYITKPFSMDELMARVTAHLRREQRHAAASHVRFSGELVIDYGSRTVFWGNQALDFSNKEFEIIRFLSLNTGMVFDRETIYERLWGCDSGGDSIVVKEHIRL